MNADQDEDARVYGWRLEQLERYGYATSDAAELAADPTVDLHQLADLIDRGCPPDTAARILR